MSALGSRPFHVMNGAGNRILVVDMRGGPGAISAEEARALARNPATAFDQLMAIHDPAPGAAAREGRAAEDAADADIRILNADGSEAGACGNGMRCVAHAMLEAPGPGGAPQGAVPRGGAAANGASGARGRSEGAALRLRTRAGVLRAWAAGTLRYAIDMGPPRLGWDEVPLRDPFHDTRFIELQIGPIDAPVLHTPAALSMGNPHAVFFVDDIEAHDLARIGPMLENHPIFPDRANISLARVEPRREGEGREGGEREGGGAPDRIALKVWERGAGLTLACGSAACAALVSAARRGLTGRRAVVTLPGGALAIEWREGPPGREGSVIMTGPVELERSGRFPLAGVEAATAA